MTDEPLKIMMNDDETMLAVVYQECVKKLLLCPFTDCVENDLKFPLETP